ncbi:MAG TPA: hypothetical protein EYP40_07845 [Chromatiales bacterium]|nr:hypothetical protein [Chromatiales bacterium]
MWLETVLALLFYPDFVFRMRKLVVWPGLQGYFRRMRATAGRHHDQLCRYGISGRKTKRAMFVLPAKSMACGNGFWRPLLVSRKCLNLSDIPWKGFKRPLRMVEIEGPGSGFLLCFP